MVRPWRPVPSARDSPGARATIRPSGCAPPALAYTDVVVKDWHSRIVIKPGVRGGQPVIRGMRIAVKDIFETVADVPGWESLREQQQ